MSKYASGQAPPFVSMFAIFQHLIAQRAGYLYNRIVMIMAELAVVKKEVFYNGRNEMSGDR